MPPSSSTSGRDSRRGSKASITGGEPAVGGRSAAERREKAKSTQSYSAAYSASRRGSVQPEQGRGLGSLPERPKLKSRTNSAPNVQTKRRGSQQATHPQQQGADGVGADGIAETEDDEDEDEEEGKARQTAGMADGQDEDEVAGAVGAVRQYQPFQSPEVSEPLPEINIAVIGAEGVGKSTFVQRALDLPEIPSSSAAEIQIPVDGSTYLVRLLELPIEDVEIDDDDTVTWPEVLENKMMPRVDGAIALYDVQDRTTFDEIPEVLSAIQKAALPSVLVSAKCDTPASKRQVDPNEIERKARRSITGISTLQTTEGNVEDHKRAISIILRSILFGSAEGPARSASANRRRAQSNAVRPVSPRPPASMGHARASSELSASYMSKDQKHARHDSSLAGYASSNNLRVPKEEPADDMHRTFLMEESASEDGSLGSERAHGHEDNPHQPLGGTHATISSDSGANFEDLVDRLLMQPSSKADGKFAAIFLALYRKFAAPSRLLESIATRFDALRENGTAPLTMTVAQLRYLAIVEQWIGQYPGDFAFPKTKQRMQTFITNMSKTRICSVAAKELAAHMEMVREDDDTDWACSDKDREADNRMSVASTLIDDPSVIYNGGDLSGTMLKSEKSTASTSNGESTRPTSGSSASSQTLMMNTEAAQKHARLLQPTGRRVISKDEWRAFMEIHDVTIAKELTRMDWILFTAIRPRDFVRNAGSSNSDRGKFTNQVHVNRMVKHFDHIAACVKNYVLFRDKPKHRALMLEKWMRVARELRKLNNYHALGAVMAGIRSSPVGRLGATRELLPPDVGKNWLQLEILMNPNRSYSAYRLAWENSSGERIPYIPLLNRDLIAAEQGNPTFIGSEQTGRINFKKFELMGEVVVGIQRAQGNPYRNLAGGKEAQQVKELLLDIKLQTDDDRLHERSVQIEPSGGGGGTSEKFKQFFKR